MAGLLAFVLNRSVMGLSDLKLLTGVMAGALFVFIFGLIDDFVELPAWPQFAAQFIAGLIAIAFTIFIQEVTLPFFGWTRFPWYITYPLTIFWVMAMINTVNFLDGLDGLAAGVTAIAALLFAWHAYRLGQQTVYLFPLALAGASLGFLYFNFAPAKIFMGSVGSYFLGWALASLSILAPAKVATALLVLGIPILDVAWLFIWRWRTKGSPYVSGRDHLHFRLLDRGFSQRVIVVGYYTFCLIFGLLALLIASRVYKLMALIVLGVSTLILLWQLARVTETEK
jgi:UDP-GlcNAc:undecaprenyl-phosphate GlcNAc-1-phosphate transferase